MGVLKHIQNTFSEFLESSTIHGLVYIGTSRIKPIKLAWLIIVCICFYLAVYLTLDAFRSWEASPINTSTESLPISEVDFPEVAVCPPPGTNTALNYDIMAARNVTLDQKTRGELDKDEFNFIIF